MKGKMLLLLSVLTLCLISCSSQEEVPSATSTSTAESVEKMEVGNDAETTEEIPEEGKEYTAILHLDEDIYYETALKKGTTVPVPGKEGYEFDGYYTKAEVNYVAKDGRVTREYHGVDELHLYPKFLPLDYDIQFLYNGREISIPNQTCTYEMNLMEVLPFGELLGDECVIGFQDESGTMIIDTKKEEYSLKDLKNIIDYENREIKLNIIKTPILFRDDRMDTYEISDKGFFHQRLHAKGNAYDKFSLEEIDIQALQKLNYKYAEITISCLIQEVDSGDQYIRVYAEETTDRKTESIMESGKIEDGKEEEETTYTMNAVVPIEKLESGELYIYYNAGGFGSDDWVSRGLTITVTFRQE